MSIYSSVESLAFALHRNGYDSDNVDKVKGFVRSHRVDVLPLFLMDGHFDSYNFLSALDSVANAGDAIDSRASLPSLKKQKTASPSASSMLSMTSKLTRRKWPHEKTNSLDEDRQ